jgi:hypothetical protein
MSRPEQAQLCQVINVASPSLKQLTGLSTGEAATLCNDDMATCVSLTS